VAPKLAVGAYFFPPHCNEGVGKRLGRMRPARFERATSASAARQLWSVWVRYRKTHQTKNATVAAATRETDANGRIASRESL
jgi:hypothetical protein